MIMELYHGTDYNYADAIINDGFKCKQNLEHWLGNGVYFYIDESLAKWWTTRPTDKYGSNIEKPVIIKCTVEINDNQVLDLRRIEDYKKSVEMFKEFYNVYISYKGESIPKMEEIRSAFFDFCYIYKDYCAIIGNFYLPCQPYLENINLGYFKETHLEYIETQVCIKIEKQRELIKSKSYYYIEGSGNYES